MTAPRPSLAELYADDTWRPSAASTFGTEPTDPDAERRYFARRLAETPAPAELAAFTPYYDAELGRRVDPEHPAPAPELPAAAPVLDAPGQERLVRNDAAKVELHALVDAAAAHEWARGNMGDGTWLGDRARGLTSCRSVHAYRDAGCGSYLARPISCRVRVCPDCERARSARLAHRFAGLTLDMARAVFWTFTVPNVAAGELDRGVDWLLEAFRRLRRRAVFAGGPCRGSADCRGHRPAAGGVYALEVTWSPERGDWHPHLHALVDMPFVTWAEMRAAWRAVTCDAIRYLERGGGRVPRCAHPAGPRGEGVNGCRGASIVWVEAVRGAPGSDERLSSIRETLKYTVGGLVKSDGTLDGAGPPELGALLLALRHRRLVAGWGGWRNVTDDDPEDEQPDVLRGPDVPPELRGLPAVCPFCAHPALWDYPVEVPRRACRLSPDGLMSWHPPRAGPIS